jgi:hypothetical protein
MHPEFSELFDGLPSVVVLKTLDPDRLSWQRATAASADTSATMQVLTPAVPADPSVLTGRLQHYLVRIDDVVDDRRAPERLSSLCYVVIRQREVLGDLLPIEAQLRGRGIPGIPQAIETAQVSKYSQARPADGGRAGRVVS